MKTLSTGRKKFVIPFDNGDNAVLEFNPMDFTFFSKFQTLEKRIGDILKEHQDNRASQGLQHSGVGEQEDETCGKIAALFDDTFGKGAAEQIFKYCSPISVVDGQYYPFYFINEFTPEIVAEINAFAEKSAEKKNEYKAKYENAENTQ